MSPAAQRWRSTHPPRGFSYVELLVVVTISGMITLALMGLVSTATESSDDVRTRNELTRDARLALERMVDMVSRTHHLMLPLRDQPDTNWPEHIREQTLPASPPVGDSTFASAVLAMTLPRDIDLDQDGVPDADDDGDGRFDEDLPNDATHDFHPGIVGIDDDGDGLIDEDVSDWWDDDENNAAINEDPINGVDDDGDGNIDEDPPSDNNADGCAGICGVDDDSDGTVDNGGGADDDDEDGETFDDPYDPVVYYLSGDALIERLPAPWDTDGISAPDGPVDGRDFVEAPIASNVTRFRVERVEHSGRDELVALTLALTDPTSGETVSLQTSVRVGGGL